MLISLFFFSFLLSFLSLIILRPLAVKFKFVDSPSGRKVHKAETPLIGGICIFVSFLFSQFFFYEFDKVSIIILTASLLILVLGILDDIFNLKPKTKLFVEIIIVLATVYLTDIKVETLGNIFGLSHEYNLGLFSYVFTVLSIVGLMNAFNMIDGIDGLAGNTVILAIIGMLFFGLYENNLFFNNFLLSIMAALIPFLFFNIKSSKKTKVFLGDGGSLFLGFMISLALVYYEKNVPSFTSNYTLWCVAIPIFDFFGVVILRKIKKHSIMLANRDHAHHHLQNIGFTNIRILVIITLFGIFMLIIGILIEKYYPEASLIVFLFFFFAYLFQRTYFNRSNQI